MANHEMVIIVSSVKAKEFANTKNTNFTVSNVVLKIFAKNIKDWFEHVLNVDLEIQNQFVNTKKFERDVENVVEVHSAKNTIDVDQNVSNVELENSFANTTLSNQVVENVEQEEDGVNITNKHTIANNVLDLAFVFMIEFETYVETVVVQVFVSIKKEELVANNAKARQYVNMTK